MLQKQGRKGLSQSGQSSPFRDNHEKEEKGRKGREEGKEVGMQAGVQAGKLEVARRLLEKGMSQEEAAEVAGIGVELLQNNSH